MRPRMISLKFGYALYTGAMDLDNAERDFDVYTDLMSDDPVVEAKYEDISPYIHPGLIIDDGCGDGALLARIAHSQAFPDSYFIGVDLSSEMLERAEERREMAGAADAIIAFQQHDMTAAVPRLGRADTIISSSTTHELWSYGEGDVELRDYYGAKCMELEDGGRFIIRDVIGPDRPDDPVDLWLSPAGADSDIYASFAGPAARAEHLDELSPRARFRRFCRDFHGRPYGDDTADAFEEVVDAVVEREGKTLYRMARRDAAEYLLTKDYTDNWSEEMQESFTHWSVDDHVDALTTHCFDIVDAYSYTSDWIRENRFVGEAALCAPTDEGLDPVNYPPTNAVIAAEKRVKGR